MNDCPKGHQLNEEGFCGTCWELDPASPNYLNAKLSGSYQSPPRSNTTGESSLLCFETCRFCNPKVVGGSSDVAGGVEEARRQSRPDDVT